MKNKLIQLGFTLITISSISACTPNTTDPLVLQQDYICKSLIQGFLKTQQLSHYDLSNTTPDLRQISEQRIYRYKTTSDTNMRLNMPSQAHLIFRCDTQSNQYAIHLIRDQQQIHVMSLSVPSAQDVRQWTAYRLKNQ